MIFKEKDYPKIKDVEYDIEKRWREGIDHHPKSFALMSRLMDIDYVFNNDSLCWKRGGDGDNGESLMYALDIIFDEDDKIRRR
jgi:hypothetical protein